MSSSNYLLLYSLDTVQYCVGVLLCRNRHFSIDYTSCELIDTIYVCNREIIQESANVDFENKIIVIYQKVWNIFETRQTDKSKVKLKNLFINTFMYIN